MSFQTQTIIHKISIVQIIEKTFKMKTQVELSFYGNISPIKSEDNKFVFIQRC